MQTFEAIAQRRAVKHYDPQYRMQDAEIKQLLCAAMLSPTSFNIQHWRFVVVSDTEQRQQLREAAWGQAQVTDASLLVLICADVSAWQNQPQRYWQSASEENRTTILQTLQQFYQGRPEMQHDEALRSCGIAAQTLMLAAKDMGYDSSPMVGFDFDQVAESINLPKEHIIGMMLAVGKASQAAWPRGGQLSYDEVVIENRFA